MRQLFAIVLISLLLPSILALVSPAVGTEPTSPEVQHPLLYRPVSLSSPGVPPFVPVDIRKAYDFLPLYSKGIQGNGTRIAIVDAFGDPTLSTDLSSFDSLTGLPTASVNIFYPDGVPGAMVMANAKPDGGLELARDYWVNFPDGYRSHQVRLDGGDCSTDSFCYPSV